MSISGGFCGDEISFEVSSAVADEELHGLFDAAWEGHQRVSFQPVLQRSLAWITARDRGRLVGFVNVAGDGGVHAFLLDTTVHPDHRRNRIGHQLVLRAASAAREGGARWLHVDYEQHLEPFYAGCGFRDTAAGLMRLD